jgi:hypothetical protein
MDADSIEIDNFEERMMANRAVVRFIINDIKLIKGRRCEDGLFRVQNRTWD